MDTLQPTTKEKMLIQGVKLFAKRGFEAASTRMIANEMGVNISAISFHFGSKEGYYKAVLEYGADIIRRDYQKFVNKIDAPGKAAKQTKKVRWKRIEDFINYVIFMMKDPAKYDYMMLLFQENLAPPGGEYPITRVVYKEAETILAGLLQDYWGVQDERSAVILSRTINGALVSYGEHPVFIRRALGLKDDAEVPEDVWNKVRDFTLKAIRAYVP